MANSGTRATAGRVQLPITLVFAFIVGCGESDGPVRFDLSGNVTFRGKPVPSGYIVFRPRQAKGNQRQGSSTDIIEGKYATRPKQGVVGGPHEVTISGTDGVPFDMGGGVMNPMGRVLFPEYHTVVDLPTDSGQYDLEVPAPPGSR